MKRNSPIDLVQQNGGDTLLEIFNAAVVFTGQLREVVVAGNGCGLATPPSALTRLREN